jgi:5-methylphenazine-1-carboxylate 1-monooxygenase
MQVIVVGAGIGGLSLALQLHQAGISVRVYEAVRELAPLGVGINLQPNAVRELTELGLDDELAQTGLSIQKLCYFNKFGQLIQSQKRGIAAGYKWPQYSIHRGQLQLLLLRAVRARLGNDVVRTGLKLVGFEQDQRRVIATFHDNRSGETVQDGAEVLVGADGIHSTVRQRLYPAEGQPRFAQQLLWRAAVETEPFLGGRDMVISINAWSFTRSLGECSPANCGPIGFARCPCRARRRRAKIGIAAYRRSECWRPLAPGCFHGSICRH